MTIILQHDGSCYGGRSIDMSKRGFVVERPKVPRLGIPAHIQSAFFAREESRIRLQF